MIGEMKSVEERGWRELIAGEIVQKGDRLWDKPAGQWIDVNYLIGWPIVDGIRVIRPKKA
jgi:hypothetical protein